MIGIFGSLARGASVKFELPIANDISSIKKQRGYPS
jgi:hypothetical protein